MRTGQLFTIGYEGAELTDFVATLSACRIGQVIDIRDRPLSRKPGFSRKALSQALCSRGIAYLHLGDLGDPKPGREAARRGEFDAFREIYGRHLSGRDAQHALGMAARAAREVVSCLLCFERAHEHCHRAMVAAALARGWGFTVSHLGVRRGAGPDRKHDPDRVRDREPALG